MSELHTRRVGVFLSMGAGLVSLGLTLSACGSSAEGDAPSSEASGGAGGEPSIGTEGGRSGMQSTDGSPCTLTNTNCDPDCQSSCGASPSCVDLCCPESRSNGVLCNGICKPNRCAVFEARCQAAAAATTPWQCYEIDTSYHNMPATCFCGENLGAPKDMYVSNWRVLDGPIATCEKTQCSFNTTGPDLQCYCSAEAASGQSLLTVPSCTEPPDDCACDPCGT